MSSGSSKKRAPKTITAENQFTEGVELYGNFVLSVIATAMTATITVQRTTQADFEGTPTWQDVTDSSGVAEAFTATGQYLGFEPARDIIYRAGVKTGDFTSATALVVELQQ